MRPPLASVPPLVAVPAAIVMLALSSHGTIPMVPVPITLQTLAVTLAGALLGWRWGTLAVLLWLATGALGLPVLAGGASGTRPFLGPTAGYLFAFPVAAACTGWLAERGWNGDRPAWALLAMLAGTAVCLLFGAGWLARSIGLEAAFHRGVVPFLPGGLLKSAAGAAILWGVARIGHHGRRSAGGSRGGARKRRRRTA